MIVFLRIFLKYISPLILVLVGTLKFHFLPDKVYLDWIYVIFLSSNIGFFTNYIAIRMLFHPRRKTVFNRQGLIPKNKQNIAEDLGSGISNYFFDPKFIIKYLREREAISNWISKIKNIIIDKIEDREVQQRIVDWLQDQFEKHSGEINRFFVKLSEQNLTQFITDNIDLNSLTKYFQDYIERNIDNGRIDLQEITKKVNDYIYGKIPEIAEIIYNQIEDYIDEENFAKKNVYKTFKWIMNLDKEKVEEILYAIISSDEFRAKIYLFIENGLVDFTHYIESEEGQKTIDKYYKHLITEINRISREEVIPALIDKIRKSLQQETTRNKIEYYITKILDFIEIELQKLVYSDKIEQILEDIIPRILKELNISALVEDKVRKFNTNELEGMVLSATGKHIDLIKIWGGLIGAIAGVAIFDIKVFLIIITPGILFLITERIFTPSHN